VLERGAHEELIERNVFYASQYRILQGEQAAELARIPADAVPLEPAATVA
jgi:hypothetical protein